MARSSIDGWSPALGRREKKIFKATLPEFLNNFDLATDPKLAAAVAAIGVALAGFGSWYALS